jgi:hypothetical protein
VTVSGMTLLLVIGLMRTNRWPLARRAHQRRRLGQNATTQSVSLRRDEMSGIRPGAN